MFSILATESASSAGWISMVVWLVIYFAFMYFFHGASAEERAAEEELHACRAGSWRYGLNDKRFLQNREIDVADDTVIVEFGSNKNCRIPMQKAAISAVEKPEDVTE